MQETIFTTDPVDSLPVSGLDFSASLQPAPTYLLPPSSAYPFPTLKLDTAVLAAMHRRLVGKVDYRWGAKCGITDTPEQIDCSGYVGWLLSVATVPVLRAVLARDIVGRGTFPLAGWLKRSGFKRSTVDSGKLSDGAVRVAVFLALPGVPVGHIALIQNGRTLESHGGRGVNSREWTGKGWQERCAVYVLTR